MKEYIIKIAETPSSINHPIDDFEISSGNRRPSFALYKKYARLWKNKAKYEAIKVKLPSLDGKKCHVKFYFYFKEGRIRDHDNWFMIMKAIIDGFFKEDDTQWLEQTPPDFKIDKKNPRTEIHITIK